MASGLLPKSPVSSSLCYEVPHIFIPKSHLEPREFLISSAKRLLQQYRHKADNRGTAAICPLLEVISTGRRNTWGQLAINNDDGYRPVGIGRVVSTVSTLGRVNEAPPFFDRLSSQNRVMICKR